MSKETLDDLLESLDIDSKTQAKIKKFKIENDLVIEKLTESVHTAEQKVVEFDTLKTNEQKLVEEVAILTKKVDQNDKDVEDLLESCSTQIDAQFQELQKDIDSTVLAMKPEIDMVKITDLLESVYGEINTSEKESKLTDEVNELKCKLIFKEKFKDVSDADKGRAEGLLEGVSSPDSYDVQSALILDNLIESNNVSEKKKEKVNVLKYI